MSSRRNFMKLLGLAVGGGLSGRDLLAVEPDRLNTPSSPRHRLQQELTAVNAAGIEVSPGLWMPIRIPDIRTEFLRLRMPDGARLAATLYLPNPMLRNERVPGLIKVTPYRKDDDSLGGDLKESGFYARNGYAVIRLDVRGTGGSEGVPIDEYSEQEHEDTLHVIDWLSKQPWCNGNIGMWGMSYSAFNAVQVAALNPPALKAIMAIEGTDDRYTDDVHYLGGCLQLMENMWALGMVKDNAMPGAPDYDVHSQASETRFGTPPWIINWLNHQTDGPYWRHGSLRPDYSRLRIPSYLITGWLDGYQNFVPRIMRYSPATTKALIGPWKHDSPDAAAPGPSIDFQNQCALRWWDHWLKGIDTGFMDEPPVTYYMQRWYRQSFMHGERVPGEWRHAASWPQTFFEPKDRLYLRPEPECSPEALERSEPAPGRGGRLAEMSGAESALKLRYYPWVGTTSKSFAPGGDGFYGLDQRGDDAYGLSFETDPVREDVEILGFAYARLFVSTDVPVTTWVVRLCDVAPDGTSDYVARGVLNGTHRNGHERPEALVPGEVYELDIELHCVAWTFRPGHRIRVIITNGDWPLLWPAPYAATTVLHCGGDRPSHIDLPVLPADQRRSLPGPKFREPPAPDFENPVKWRGHPYVWELTRDAVNERHSLHFARKSEMIAHPAGITGLSSDSLIVAVSDRDPAQASLEMEGVIRYTREGRTVEARMEGALRSTVDEFLYGVDAVVSDNGREVRRRRWEERFQRNLG